jgi:hypothetical protein
MPRKQKNGVRPERYVPDSLTNEDKLKQVLMLLKSRSDYEEKTFQTRKTSVVQVQTLVARRNRKENVRRRSMTQH